jgi:hypothetical protein
MDIKARIAIILVLASLSGLLVPTRARAQQESGQHFAGGENEDSILRYLRPTLRAAGYAGRVYYSGACKTEGLEFVAFPQVDVHPPKGNSALDAVREMFRGDADIQVVEEPHKIISVTVGKPLITLLDTRIPLFKMVPIAQYNPTVAIGAVENTEEMKAAMAKLDLRVPLQLSAQLLAKPSPGLPHLRAEMRDVTVDQLLDSIAATFQGIVVYGTCVQSDGKGLLEIDFVGLDGPDKPRS